MKRVIYYSIIIMFLVLTLTGCKSNKENLSNDEKNTSINKSENIEGLFKPKLGYTDEEALTTPLLVIHYMDGITLNKDGTCEATNNTPNDNCSYKYEDNVFKLSINDFHFEFKKINEYTLKDQFGYTWYVNDLISSLNGEATAFWKENETSQSYKPVYQTIYFYDDLTCDVENLKQESSDYIWRFYELYEYKNCTYKIDGLTLFLDTTIIKNQKSENVRYIYDIDLDRGTVSNLAAYLTNGKKRDYYFSYKTGKDFGKESLEIQEEQINKTNNNKKLLIGRWDDDKLKRSFYLKDDYTCTYNREIMAEGLYKTSNCIWKTSDISPVILDIEYEDRYSGKLHEIFYLHENKKYLVSEKQQVNKTPLLEDSLYYTKK